MLKDSAQEDSASSLTAADAASSPQSAAAAQTPPVTPGFVSDSSDSNGLGTLPLLGSADRESFGSTHPCLSSSLVRSVISLALFGPEPSAVL